MLAVRYGGLFYLKYINEGDQSVIEGLNSLLEVEQKFVVDNENIHIHPRFRFICSVVTDK
jgi:midasin (ATPase involved in ribosome maturation)